MSIVYFADVKAGTLWKSSKGSIAASAVASSYADDAGLHPLLAVVDAKSADARDTSRAVKIACVAFRSHDVSIDLNEFGEEEELPELPNLALVDQRGHVYVFSVEHDSFDLVARTGISGTAIALGAYRPWELIVAFSDHSLHCYNIETMKATGKLPQNHRTNVKHISVHPSATRVLTTADTEAVLWDSEDWVKLQALTGADGTRVNQTGFSPNGEYIIAAFDDNSLVVWETFTLALFWRLDATTNASGSTPLGMNCWAVSSDGAWLATGGWKAVQVWSLAGHRISREMTDPRLLEGVHAISFIGDTHILVVQNKDGDLLFMNAEHGSVKFIANVYPVKSFSISPDGRLIAVHPGSAPTAVTMWSLDELLAFEYIAPLNAIRPGAMTPERSPSTSSRRSNSAGSTAGSSRVPRRVVSGNFSRSPDRMGSMRRDPPSSAKSVANRRSYQVTSGSGDSRVDEVTKRRSLTLNAPPDSHHSPSMSPKILTPRHRRRQSMKLEPPSPVTATAPRSGQLLEDRPRSHTILSHDPGHQRHPSRFSSASSIMSGFDNSLNSINSTLTAGPMLNNIDLNDLNEAEASKIYESLERFIRKRGGFPDEHRLVIWRFLLKLPDDHSAYRTLERRGVHPCIEDMRTRFQLKDKKLQNAMERTMSALAHWCPRFADLAYLPFLSFPFLKLFQDDLPACFEIVVTIFVNWCQDWWDTYPNPPTNTLRAIEELLHQYDPDLFRHFHAFGVGVDIYGWIPLQSFFSECLPRQHWSRLWDNSFSRQPRFLYHFSVAFVITVRDDLLMLDSHADFEEFFHRQQTELDMKRALKLAAKLNTGSYGSESDAFASFRPFRQLPRPADGAPVLVTSLGEMMYPPLERLIARDDAEGEGEEAHPGSFGEMDDLMQQRLAAMRLE